MNKAKTATARKTNIENDKRSYWLSHEAFLSIQAMARKQGIEPGPFLEIESRRLAQEWLTDEQRASIKEQAERITAERRHAAEQTNNA